MKVWSMDFVFDRVAGGRSIKNVAIIDDATHEAVAVVPEHSISSHRLVQILEMLCSHRGYPTIIRTDNGKEFVVGRCSPGRRMRSRSLCG